MLTALALASTGYVAAAGVGCACFDLGGPELHPALGVRADAALSLGAGMHLGVRAIGEGYERQTMLAAGPLLAGRWGRSVHGGFTIAGMAGRAYRFDDGWPALALDATFDLAFPVSRGLELFADTYVLMLRASRREVSAHSDGNFVYTNAVALPAVAFGVRATF